jgi:hypothetical protein
MIQLWRQSSSGGIPVLEEFLVLEERVAASSSGGIPVLETFPVLDERVATSSPRVISVLEGWTVTPSSGDVSRTG